MDAVIDNRCKYDMGTRFCRSTEYAPPVRSKFKVNLILTSDFNPKLTLNYN